MRHLKSPPTPGGEHDLTDNRQAAPKRASRTNTTRAINRAKPSDLSNTVIGIRPHMGDLLKLRALEASGVKLADYLRSAISEKLSREAA